jgi:hypothetical protein
MFDLILNDLKDPLKNIKAHETSLKQPQNETRLSSNLTPRSEKDR